MNRHAKIRQDLSLPQLTPDVIDDFVTWLTGHGYDLQQYSSSDLKYKRDLFDRFWRDYPDESKNYKIEFP